MADIRADLLVLGRLLLPAVLGGALDWERLEAPGVSSAIRGEGGVRGSPPRRSARALTALRRGARARARG